MNVFAIVGAGIAAAALSAVLRQYNKEFGLYISLGASAVILIAVLFAVNPLLELVSELNDAAGTDTTYLSILLKAVAVCYVTQLASDCCKDSGEAAIASRIDFAGRIAVLLISVPLFESMLSLIKDLIF